MNALDGLPHGWLEGPDYSLHFFLRPGGQPLALASTGRHGARRVVTLWELCVLEQASQEWALAYVVGSDPRSCLVCRGLSCAAQSDADVPRALRARAPGPGDDATAQNLLLVEKTLRVLREGLPHVFDRGQGQDSSRRTETAGSMCRQTCLLSANVRGAEELCIEETPEGPEGPTGPTGPSDAGGARPKRLRGLGFAAACGCADTKPLAVVRWRSAACHSLWMQSTLLYDARRLREDASVLLENVVVFRHCLVSASRARLEDTWLPEATPLAPGTHRPLPWFPGAGLAVAFEIDVLVVFAGKAPAAPRDRAVFLDEELAGERTWPSGALVPTLEPPPGNSSRRVEFVFACFPDLVYAASAFDGASLVELCATALEQEGLPAVALETALDQYVPVVGGRQARWLSTDLPAHRVLLLPRAARAAPQGSRGTPELERRAPVSADMRLLHVLAGRLQPRAARAGVGFVLNPIIWWALAKLHYQPGADRRVTQSFFPLAERAWTGAGDAREARNWRGYLTAADSCLASERGRSDVLTSWLGLLDSPLGHALLRLLDESVTYFVAECDSAGVEDMRKILFASQGFVPLRLSTWDPRHLERLSAYGVVPHSNATLLRSPATLHSPRHIEHLTLIGLLSAFPSSLARSRGAALNSVVNTLRDLVFTRHKRRQELFPAVLYLRSSPPSGLLLFQ